MILKEFCANPGYHRKYAIRLLRGARPEEAVETAAAARGQLQPGNTRRADGGVEATENQPAADRPAAEGGQDPPATAPSTRLR